MQRTKPTAKQIKEEQQILENPPHGEFGGFMPNPPEDCTARRPFIGADGTEYVDMSLCGHCTRKKCERHRQHCKDMDNWFQQCHEIVEARKARKRG